MVGSTIHLNSLHIARLNSQIAHKSLVNLSIKKPPQKHKEFDTDMSKNDGAKVLFLLMSPSFLYIY